MAKLIYGEGVVMSPEALAAFEAEAQALPASWEVEALMHRPSGTFTVAVSVPHRRVAAILSFTRDQLADPDRFDAGVLEFLRRQDMELDRF